MCVLKDIPQAQVKGSSIVGAVHVNENLTLRSKFSFKILHVLFYFVFQSILFFSLFSVVQFTWPFFLMNFIIKIISLLNIYMHKGKSNNHWTRNRKHYYIKYTSLIIFVGHSNKTGDSLKATYIATSNGPRSPAHRN